MRLADEVWVQASFDDVVRCVLDSEADRFEKYFELCNADRDLIERVASGSFAADTLEGALRRALLGLIRFGLFHHVPPTTKWFTVPLRSTHLDELQ
jgi:hypothetical protein